MQTLADKIALVTGASSGIGRAAARLFARHGATIIAVARREPPLDDLVAELTAAGARAIRLAGDVADPAFAAEVARQIEARFGGLDIAFGNAGTIGPMGPTTDIDLADWQRTMAVNLTGAFLLARHAIPLMRARGGGSIVFTSSFVGHTVGFPGMAAYAASKAGVIGFTKALAAELGREGIRVNALLPGGTDTPMGRAVADTPEARAHVAGLHALGRLAEPAEIAESALFLASDASRFTTGTALLADGGVSIHR